MKNLLESLQPTHRFFKGQGMYPVLLSTLLAGSLLAARFFLSRQWTFYFLVWNLMLAWIPYASSLWAAHLHRKHPRRWWVALIPGGLWLAFFPNAPYIVTDFLHLSPRAPIPMWYDIGLLASFAWTGLFLAVYSLRTMQAIVKTFLGTVAGWLFVLGVFGMSGLGIYLGRFLRWNSWDLVFHPRAVLADVAVRVTNPLNHPGAVGVTLMFAALLFVCYVTLTAVPATQESL